MKYFIILLFLFLNIDNSYSAKLKDGEYFASLRSSQTNVRSGPGMNYPIKFTFHLKSIPVKVIRQYDNWNEIEDFNGDHGWINRNLLTKKRTIIVRTEEKFINLHVIANKRSKILLRLQNNVIGSYLACKEKWCAIKVKGKKGWVEKQGIWGI